jgi:hypothetical protein
MGYAMETTGRLLLPVDRESAAFDAVSAAIAGRDGWYDPDDAWPITSVADLATVAGASAEREGEWLVLGTDEEGDPKWSDQATAFYVGLARWVSEGSVLLSGEDGTEWSYSYADGAVSQSGLNGWDGSTEPFGEPVEDEPAPAVTPVESMKRRGWFRRR